MDAAVALREAPPAPPASPFVRTAALPPPPEDATTLARASLLRIQTKIRAALLGKAVTDVTTRAHLQESQARIAAALGAQMEKGVD